VGQTRLTIEADITKLGFFTEYSKDSLQFDTDEELYEHISREMIMAANEITEDVLQMDLLNGAGVNRYAGIATIPAEIIGEGADISEVSYTDLQRLAIDMDNNRTPKKTKVITGSRMVDTRVVAAGRYMYHGSEMVPTLSKMKDHHNNAAFVGVEHYAYNGVAGVNSINGEIGKVGDFRLIQVPEMEFWEGAGAVETGANAGYRATGGNYDVFPMLVVGDGSFTTIGFQTDGKSTKFKIKHRMPETDGAYTKDDPFGELGFTSIKWWYGTLVMRPERLAVVRTVAEI
jgi:N4-gp56 family major capsid protein